MIKLCVFDYNGVIVQTETIHVHKMMDMLKEFSIQYSMEDISVLMGGNKLTRPVLMEKRFGHQETFKKNRQKILTGHRTIYPPADQIKTPHIKEILAYLQEQGIHITLCSNSSLDRVREGLKQIEIDSYFECLYSGMESGHAKPDPYIYLSAMKQFQAYPNETLVIEDSEVGIHGAKLSGAYVAALKDPDGLSVQHEADWIIKDLLEIKSIVKERQ